MEAVFEQANPMMSLIDDSFTKRILEEDSSRFLEGETCGEETKSVLVELAKVYISILAAGLLIFCVIRKKLPRIFTTRKWVAEVKSPLASDQFGYFSWIWKVYSIDSEELMKDIGLDATCFLRLMNMGFRLSMVGAINSIVLLPLYGTAAKASDYDRCGDEVENVAIQFLENGAPQFAATIVATYIFFGYTMYTMLKEFKWFLRVRGKWLRRFKPRNYTILVRNIPEKLRNDKLLKLYYEKLYGKNCVLAAHVLIHCSKVDSLVDKRKVCVGNLEHSLAELAIKGKRSTRAAHGDKKLKVDSIDFYTEELNKLNEDISHRLDEIKKKQRSDLETRQSEGGSNISSLKRSKNFPQKSSKNLLSAMASGTTLRAGNAVSRTRQKAGRGVNKFLEKGKDLLAIEEDGVADDAAFVTFTRLTAAYGAVQMNQSEEPYVLEGEMAPDKPRYLFWKMLGKDRETRQLGFILSMAATVAFCFFWTFVVTAFVGLVDVTKLKENPDTNQWLKDHPGIEALFNILYPLLFNILSLVLMPVILKFISQLELLPADSVLEASAFRKMALFTIIQNFFVNLVSSSVINELGEIVQEPVKLFELLADTLPGKASFYIKSMMVTTCISSLMELFRVVPLIQAFFRRHLGRRLTKKERALSSGPFHPISVVNKMVYSRLMNRYVFYYLVLYVYSAMTPIINWFTLVLFLFAGSVYRHQFIYIYPNTPDSGGQMWLIFMNVQLICIIIAQVTLLAFLTIKQSWWAVAMIPLLVIQSLFIVYLHQRHFKIGAVLPAYTALEQDLENTEKSVDFSVFKDEYVHPALKEPFLDADWDAGKFEDKEEDDNSVENGEKGKEKNAAADVARDMANLDPIVE